MYNPRAMKKIVHAFFVVFLLVSGLISGGAHVAYPVLERILANIERTHSPEDAALIRSHTDAGNRCGVRAVVCQNSDSKIGFGTAHGSAAHLSMPIAMYALDHVDVHDFLIIRETLLCASSASAFLLRPPCLIV